jgi:hypothetical protein
MDLLKEIGVVLRKEETDFLELSTIIKRYKSFVLELANVEMDTPEAREDIYSNNGKAVGTVWAAFCLDDMIRTKMFVQGIFNAIEYLKTKNHQTVHVLYAGTGPFATLALPIMAAYSPEEVQFTLLEINDLSLKAVKNVIHALNFDKYVRDFVQADATKHILDAPNEVDIVLSETMQCGLGKEQQVPIVENLMKQVRKDAILIPEKVRIDLALLKTTVFEEDEKEEDYMLRLGELFELSAQTLATEFSKAWRVGEQLFFPKKNFFISKEQFDAFKQLVLITEIQVFDKVKITFNQSSLTIPVGIKQPQERKDTYLEIGYKVDDCPYFVYSFSDKSIA